VKRVLVAGIIALLAVVPAAHGQDSSGGSKDVARGNHWDALLRDGTPIYDDAEVTARVAEVGQKVVTASGNPNEFAFRFAVLNSVEATAFAAPGGYVYVTTGLLRALRNEDELAGVLGHEIGHINEHHAMRTGMSQRARTFWAVAISVGSSAAGAYLGSLVAEALAPYAMSYSDAMNIGRIAEMTSMLAATGTSQVGQRVVLSFYQGYKPEFEFKADELSLAYSAKAGYKPEAFVDVLDRLSGDGSGVSPIGVSRLSSTKAFLVDRSAKARAILGGAGKGFVDYP
jgi:beta-barrel assembly-enhancing protease